MNAAAAVIDCHALVGVGSTWYDPERKVDYTVSELLDRGAQAGIARHCVYPARSEAYPEANRAVARMCAEHRGKLIGFAAHNPQTEAGQLRRLLTEEVKLLGLRGLRSDGPPTRELMDAAQELSIPVMYYPKPARGQAIGGLVHMPASAYPKVNLVIPHMGQFRSLAWAPHMEALDLAKRYPNVHLDTSGLGSFKYLEMAMRELPAEKILFGTFAPELDPRVEREALRLLKLTAAAFAKVAGGNLLRLIHEA